MLFGATAASLLTLFSVVNAAMQNRIASGTVYAYGAKISGLEIYMANDVAWIGNPELAGLPNTSNLTFTTTINNTVQVSSPEASWLTNEDPLLYINRDGFSQVGFLFSNETQTSNETTVGFSWFGKNLVWTNNSTFESSFWATESNTTGLWKLCWNSDSTIYTKGTPVALRTVRRT